MKQILIAIALLFSTTAAWSAMSGSMNGVQISVEPIIGYETVFRPIPTPHTATRLVYGARVVAGVQLLSGELEYTKAQDTENYAVAPEKIINYDDKVKLGVRSTYNLGSYVFASVRLGGQAWKNSEEVTTSGVTTKTDHDIKIDPYAGAGLGVHITNLVALSAGVTAVIYDTSDMGKNDYQYTLSVAFGR